MEQIGLKNDVVKLQQILGSKLYSSKYSFISEVCQNATDSMRKAGKQDQPFDLGIDEDAFFFVRDYGTSFEDKETIVKYLCTLLESSKTQVKDENENQEIGKYGIGKISSAAYNSEWFYNIYKNGKGIDLKVFEIENKGIFYEFTSDYYDTTEPDGVLYRIKLQENVRSFIENLFIKVKYFQNIFFKFHERYMDLIGRDVVMLNDNFKVYKTDDFQYSTLVRDTKFMHICIDQYAYPINWDAIGLSPIEIPVGLKFGLDELDINPTREALIMNDTYAEKICNKIDKVIQWFIDKYNEQNPVVTYNHVEQYKIAWDNAQYKSVKFDEDIEVGFNDVVSKRNLFNQLNSPELEGVPRHEFTWCWEFAKSKFRYLFTAKASIWRRKLSRDPYITSMNTSDNNYFLDVTFSIYKKDYFKALSGNTGDRYDFYEVPNIKYEMFHEVGHALYTKERFYYSAMFNIDKDLWEVDEEYTSMIQKRIDTYHKFMEMFTKSYFTNISTVDIPAPPKKKRLALTAATGEMKIKKARNNHRYSDNNCTFEEGVINLEHAYKAPQLAIYGLESDKSKLDSLYPAFKNKVSLLILNEKNLKIMDNLNLHNFVNINKIKDNLDYVSAVLTSHHINQKLLPYENVIEKKEIIRKFISVKLANDLDTLQTYATNYSKSRFMNDWKDEASSFMGELYKMFLDNPVLFKGDATVVLDRVLSEIKKVDFVVLFDDKITDRNRWTYHEKDDLLRQVDAIRDLCKYRAKKMDWQHYKPFILDEQQECEPTTA